jgi:phage FluMu protein Com
MLFKIKCPKCDTDGSFSLADLVYEGPYKCWKCRELFNIKVENNELKSCEPITEEEFNRQQQTQQEIEALRAKFRKQ